MAASRPNPGCLRDGATIAIVGAGPAGSFFALLALQEAKLRGMAIRPVLFDGKSFLEEGPLGCNMCAGVISWNLVRQMERIGLRIPDERVQRVVRSYVFHTREGSHAVVSPPGRGPIPVVFRGNGPRFSKETRRISFDDFLLEKALERGAEIVPSYVDSISLPLNRADLPEVAWPGGSLSADLVVIACGVGSRLAGQLASSGLGYRPPRCVRAYQAELDVGETRLRNYLGESIHVFSLGIRDIRFGAIIPKSRFATVSLVGDKDLTHEHLEEFLHSPVVRGVLPPDWALPERYCHCRPRLPVAGAANFHGERILFVGDASISRFYKNGIDSAFMTARYAVQTAFDHGLSARALARSYGVYVRRAFVMENRCARILFRLNDFVAAKRVWVRAHMYFVFKRPFGRTAQTLHFLTWNLFTGDASYRAILRATMRPSFVSKMILAGVKCSLGSKRGEPPGAYTHRAFALSPKPDPLGPLTNGRTVAVVGGGPAGTSCAIALKRMASERGIDLRVVLYEGKIFENERHFNQCAGVLSPPIEDLIKDELGLEFPYGIVERTIRSYRLCGDRRSIRLSSSMHSSQAVRRTLFDCFMIGEARKHGVEVMGCRISHIEQAARGVVLYAENGTLEADVVVGAFGLDPGSAAIFQDWIGYRRPKVLETVVTNIYGDQEWLDRFGDEIVAFLPATPGISFGAMTPKRTHLTVNIAGERVRAEDMKRFLSLPEVKRWLPPGYDADGIEERCYKGCFPNRPARVFFADRFVAVGDAAGLVRPFKGKGITSACMTGIAAAKVMLDYGVSEKAFFLYRNECGRIISDRRYGWLVQKLADTLRATRSVDALLYLAESDPVLRRSLFLSVSGEEPYKRILREGFAVSRCVRILLEVVREKVSATG